MAQTNPVPRRAVSLGLLAAAGMLASVAVTRANDGAVTTVVERNADLVVGYVRDAARGRRIGAPALQAVRGEPVRAGRQAGSDGRFVPSGVVGVVTLHASRDLCERVMPRLAGIGDLALNGAVAGSGAAKACRDDEGFPGKPRNIINVRFR